MNVFGDLTVDDTINSNHVDGGTETLYSEQHTVQLGSNSDKQKKVRIIINARNSLHHKILRIRIIDENNPFYMYSVELNDEAYSVLRQKQGLLVDFANFPNEFVSLLQKCRQHTQLQARFFAIIEDDSSSTNDILGRHHIICKIVETNCLKYLCYVMLTLSPVDVSEISEDVFLKMQQLKSQEILLKEMEQKEQDLKKSHALMIKDMNSQMDQLRIEDLELATRKLELENTIRYPSSVGLQQNAGLPQPDPQLLQQATQQGSVAGAQGGLAMQGAGGLRQPQPPAIFNMTKQALQQLLQILKSPNMPEKQQQILQILKSDPQLMAAFIKERQVYLQYEQQ